MPHAPRPADLGQNGTGAVDRRRCLDADLHRALTSFWFGGPLCLPAGPMARAVGASGIRWAAAGHLWVEIPLGSRPRPCDRRHRVVVLRPLPSAPESPCCRTGAGAGVVGPTVTTPRGRRQPSCPPRDRKRDPDPRYRPCTPSRTSTTLEGAAIPTGARQRLTTGPAPPRWGLDRTGTSAAPGSEAPNPQRPDRLRKRIGTSP